MDEEPVLDLRTYTLKPGAMAEFQRILIEHAMPMLRRHGIEVVAHGPSLEDPDMYYLLRSFPSAAVRKEQLAGFYCSREWLDNYDSAVMSLIDSYHVVVLPASELPGLRAGR